MLKIIAPAFALTACVSSQEPPPASPELTGNVCLDASNAYTNPYMSEPQRELLLELMRENDCFSR